jgi:aspartate carbamoyltransferase catalytic subunit
MKTNPLFQKDILSADQFDRPTLDLILANAKKMKQLVEKQGATDILHGKVMTALFYEPSSRTFGSFITAMQRLGGGFIPLQGVVYSSVSKGETLPDTVRTFASFSDVVVLRHPEVGSAKIAAEFCEKPVINAGDGVGEHPTQAILDFFTITNHFGTVEGKTITLVGDLLNGRTIHSLLKLLILYKDVNVNLVSPDLLKLPKELFQRAKENGLQLKEYESLDDVLSTSDVLYITRVQKERFTDLESYERVKHFYVINPTVMKKAKKTTILMHPFPRVGEISMDVDLDQRAIYIREQIPNGLYVRMALLSLVLAQQE